LRITLLPKRMKADVAAGERRAEVGAAAEDLVARP